MSVGTAWSVLAISIGAALGAVLRWLLAARFNPVWPALPLGTLAAMMACDAALGRKNPWQELFTLLRGMGYDRYTLAEIPGSSDPERVMRYYGDKVDENELAQVANTNTAGGTSSDAMVDALKKLSARLKVV